jgi:hypothetical protein
MTRTIFLRHFALLLLALAMSACATVTRHGDARLRDNRNVIFVMMDELVFPGVSIGRAATSRYRVRDLPQAIYPRGFDLEVPAEEASVSRHDQPWRRCLIRASLSTPDGETFFSRTLDLSKDWNGNSSPGHNSKHRSLFLSFTGFDYDRSPSYPKHLSYDLEIQVVHPSLRATDTLRVDALTLLMDRHGARIQ